MTLVVVHNVVHFCVPTIVQRPLQDGRRTGFSISDPSESKNLDLVEHIFPQTGQLDAVGSVPLHRPEVDCPVRVFLLVRHLIQRADRPKKFGPIW